MSVALKWLNGSLEVLDSIAGAVDSFPWCIDANGTLYGNSDTTFVKWVGTAVTPLAGSGDAFAQPMFCSQDGSVIVSRDGHWWTNGGATLAMLSPAAPYTSVAITGISDDGSIIIGSSGGNPAQATVWLNGVPSLLPLFSTGPSGAVGCSADGSIVVGGDFSSNVLTEVAFWVNGVRHTLAGSGSFGEALAISSDNSIITGFFNETVPCYWTGILTAPTQVSMGGEVHSSSVAPILNGGVPVLAGFFDSDSYRWIGTTQTLLPRLVDGTFSQTAFNNGTDFGASCLSEDGSIVIGRGNDFQGFIYPIYWDAAGAVHQLPVTGRGAGGLTTGLSRDGTIIFGNGDASPPGQLELVTLLPMNQPSDVFAVANNVGAGFGTTFSQFSLSGWFCNEVHIQGPYGLDTPFFEMDFSPTTASFRFDDVSGDVLFSGSFTNNGLIQNPYNICFSVQTEWNNHTEGLIWQIGGAASRLPSVSGASNTSPLACSANGAIVVGLSINPSAEHAVKWTGTTISELPNFPNDSVGYLCSQDGSIITGFWQSGSPESMIRWTGGGSVGAAITPYPGYDFAGFSNSLLSFRGMSDDGSVILGTSVTNGFTSSIATVWTNGVPSSLPNGPLGPFTSLGANPLGCSSDGTSLIFGNGIGASGLNPNMAVGVYWIGGVQYQLGSTGHGFSVLNSGTECCNAAGTILYGSIAINFAPGDLMLPVYWDTLASGNPTIHYIDVPAPYTAWNINYCSDTGTVSVGNIDLGNGRTLPVKATGTSAVLLPDLGFGGSVAACSGDGTIVVGTLLDANNFFVPVYWDAANVLHILPYPIDPTSSYSSGQVTGISRDGTLALGTATRQKYTFRGNGQEWTPVGISFPTIGDINNGLV